MHEIINSKFLQYQNKSKYYNDLSKFANLGAWILNGLGGDIDDIEKLIGEYPTLETDRELNEKDLELIEWCKENNINYEITNKGIKLGA